MNLHQTFTLKKRIDPSLILFCVDSSYPPSISGGPCGSIIEEPDEVRPRPPPLPPRRRVHSSLMDLPIKRSSEPPPPPPRMDSSVPPPVPPRRDSMPVMRDGCFNTLPRSVSVSHGRQSVSLLGNTLPRHNSDRHSTDDSGIVCVSTSSSSSVFDVNGDESVGEKPVLPPRTYKSHSRMQSS